jgi:hypothetical protein
VHAEEDPIWTQTLKYHTGFSLRLFLGLFFSVGCVELELFLTHIRLLVSGTFLASRCSTKQLKAVYRKYADEQFARVALK